MTAFGVNVLDIGPDYTTTDHTETESGQEELYLVLRGSATMLVGPPGKEDRVELGPTWSRASRPRRGVSSRPAPTARAS